MVQTLYRKELAFTSEIGNYWNLNNVPISDTTWTKYSTILKQSELKIAPLDEFVPPFLLPPSIIGQWQYGEHFGKRLVSGLYTFFADGSILESSPRGDTEKSYTGMWTQQGNNLTITWSSGAVETGKVVADGPDKLIYTITGHSKDQSQVGDVLRMTNFNHPENLKSVFSIKNNMPTEAALRVRVKVDAGKIHNWSDWRDFRIPPGLASFYSCPSGYHAQVAFTRPGDYLPFGSSYDIPVSLLPLANEIHLEDCRRFMFNSTGPGDFDLFQAK